MYAFQLTPSLPIWACVLYEWPPTNFLNATIMPNRRNIYNCKLSSFSAVSKKMSWLIHRFLCLYCLRLFCSWGHAREHYKRIGIFWDFTSFTHVSNCEVLLLMSVKLILLNTGKSLYEKLIVNRKIAFLILLIAKMLTWTFAILNPIVFSIRVFIIFLVVIEKKMIGHILKNEHKNKCVF